MSYIWKQAIIVAGSCFILGAMHALSQDNQELNLEDKRYRDLRIDERTRQSQTEDKGLLRSRTDQDRTDRMKADQVQLDRQLRDDQYKRERLDRQRLDRQLDDDWWNQSHYDR